MHCTTSTLLCIWRGYFIVWYTYSCHPDVLYIAQHSLYICNRAHECVWNQSFSKHTVDYSDIIYTCMLYTETHDLKLLLWHPAMRINWSACRRHVISGINIFTFYWSWDGCIGCMYILILLLKYIWNMKCGRVADLNRRPPAGDI